jgi:hypothetical protein
MNLCFVPFAGSAGQYPGCLSDIWTSDGGGIHDRADHCRVLLVASLGELFASCRDGLEACRKRRLDRSAVGHVEAFQNGINVVLLRDKELAFRPVAEDVEAQEVGDRASI